MRGALMLNESLPLLLLVLVPAIVWRGARSGAGLGGWCKTRVLTG